jgi:ElaB/YqjD/DUF883 family membrane-anchored ribosome-binding protein
MDIPSGYIKTNYKQMKRIFKHLIFTLAFAVMLFGSAEARSFKILNDSLELSEFDDEQKAIIAEEIDAYASSLGDLSSTDMEAWKKKINELFTKLRDGFRVYNITAKNQSLQERIDDFYQKTKIKVYVVSYVEGAFLNNLFQRLSELKYKTKKSGSIELKFKFTKADESENTFYNGTCELILDSTIILEKIRKQLEIDASTYASLGTNLEILDASFDEKITSKADELLDIFNDFECSSCLPDDLNGKPCDRSKYSEELRIVVVKSETCDNWSNDPEDDIDDVATDDFKNLCVDDRMSLIKCLDIYPTSGRDDEDLVTIFKTAPVSQRAELLKRIVDEKEIESLIRGIDGEDFAEFVETLSSWKGKPTEKDFENSILNNRLFFFNPNDALPYYFTGQGKMEFKNRKNFTFHFEQTIQAYPFEFVTVVFADDFIIAGRQFNAGEIYTFTGLEVWSLFNKSDNDKLKLAVSFLADIPLLYIGLGEIRMAKNLVGIVKALKVARGISTITVATGGLAMALGLEDQLTLTEEGREILRYWTYFNLAYAGAVLSPTAINAATGLYATCKAFLQKPNLTVNVRAGVQKIMDDLKSILNSKGHKLDDAISVWKSRGFDKIDDWINGITDATKRTQVENTISGWTNPVLQSLNTRLTAYAGLGTELANDTKLLNYFNSLETTWWSKYALGGLCKRSNSTIPSTFKQMVGDIEVTSQGTKLRLRTVTLDETSPQYIGKLFDEVVEDKIIRAWTTGNFSDFPSSIASQLQQLKNQGYHLATEVSLVINGKNPVPDLLFVKREFDALTNTYSFNTNTVKFIDTKYLWDSPFTVSQMEIVNSVKLNGFAVVRSSTAVSNVNQVQMIAPNTPFRIITVEKLTVDEYLELGIR